MKKHYTRGLSFLMTLCMVFSLFTCLGVGAFADEGELALEAEEAVVEEVAEEVALEEAAVEEEVVVALENEVSLDAATCEHRSRMGSTLKLKKGQAATCKADGWEDCYQCEKCGKYFTGYESTKEGTDKVIANYDQWKKGAGKIEKDPTNHTKDDSVKAKDPTCVDTGLNAEVFYTFYDRVGPIKHSVHYCSDCGHYYVVNQLDRTECANVDNLAIIPVDSTNHDMGDWEDDENGETHTRACQREGCKYTETEDHEFVQGECTVCGALEPVVKVTVKFHKNTYDTVVGVPADQQVDQGSKLAWPDTPVRKGYDFYGWFTSWQCRPDDEWDFNEDTFEEDTDLYAKWVQIYKVVYDAGRGTLDGMQPQGYMSNLPDPLATATREGYELEGWYLDRGLTQKAVPGAKLTKDTTLYAKWVKAHVCSKDTLTLVPKVPATCCAYGCEEYYTCSCGKNFYDKNARYEIQNLTVWKATLGWIDKDPDNHATEPKLTAQVDPTCTEDGLKAYYYCESCMLYFSVNSEGKIGTRIGNKAWFDYWCKTEPTRETRGWGGLLPALGHDLADVKGLAPTCCEDGYEAACQCQREGCKAYFTTDEEPIEEYEAWKLDEGRIPALGHDLKLVEDRLEPTCLDAGHLAYYQCDRDGCKLYFYNMDDLAPAPEEQLLQLDSKVLSFGLIGDKADLDKWLAEGGDGYLAPLDHDWSDWEDNEDGTHSRVCKNDPSHVETEKHEFKDGECVKCGAEEPKPAPKKPAPPKTGDNGHALLWAAMALTMGCGATAVVLKKKHN